MLKDRFVFYKPIFQWNLEFKKENSLIIFDCCGNHTHRALLLTHLMRRRLQISTITTIICFHPQHFVRFKELCVNSVMHSRTIATTVWSKRMDFMLFKLSISTWNINNNQNKIVSVFINSKISRIFILRKITTIVDSWCS